MKVKLVTLVTLFLISTTLIFQSNAVLEIRKIKFGQSIDGVLKKGDAQLDVGSFYDVYVFEGVAGQKVIISMSSDEMSTFVILAGDSLDADSFPSDHDKSKDGSKASFSFTLPETEEYMIFATTYFEEETGRYTISLKEDDVPPPLKPTPIKFGQSINGVLEKGDEQLDGTFVDVYAFEGVAGQEIIVTMSSDEVSTFVMLVGGDLEAGNAPSAYDKSRVGSKASFSFTLPKTDEYLIGATTYFVGETGRYTISLTDCQPQIIVKPNLVDFGDVPAGESTAVNISISNDGCDPLNVTDIASTLGGILTISKTNFTVAPDATYNVTLILTPSIAGEMKGTLTIVSNDKDSPTTIDITGYVLPSGCSATFVVTGIIYEEDGKTLLSDGVEVTVKNLTKSTIQTAQTGSTGIDGGYTVTFIDTQTNAAACVGDEVEVTVSLNGRSGKSRHEVRKGDVDANKAEVNVVISSGGDVTFVVNYSRGINMISVPLDPDETWKMSDLLKHIGSEASMVIWYDKGAGKFTTFMPNFPENSPTNTMVKGGEGYILIMTKAKEVTYEGKAWQNVSSALSPTVVLSNGSDVKTPIFAVTGLIKGQGGSYLDGIKVTVCNLNTGQKTTTVTGTTAGHGRYVVTLTDFTEGIAAQLDDTFSINVSASQRGFTNNSVELKITHDDIQSANVTFDFTIEKKPSKTALLQNYPNPFNPETWIPHQLAEDCEVNISIYDCKGQPVHLINLGVKPAGVYFTKDRAVYWDGRNDKGEKVASGLYFYQLKAGDFSSTRKMVILK